MKLFGWAVLGAATVCLYHILKSLGSSTHYTPPAKNWLEKIYDWNPVVTFLLLGCLILLGYCGYFLATDQSIPWS